MNPAVRIAFPGQPTLDVLPIAQVSLNTHCRVEIIPILAALQHLYSDEAAHDDILALLAKDINASSDPNRGRPGFSY